MTERFDHTIIRYSEIALKGKNRKEFEDQLIRNIKDCYARAGITKVAFSRPRGRIIIHNRFISQLQAVFGIHSISPCIELPQDIDAIKQELSDHLDSFDKKISFRISVQRTDKSFPLKSMQLERELGSFVVEKSGAKVDLKNFDKEIGVELVNRKAYVFFEKIHCFGGMPVGSQGKALLSPDSEFCSLAALLMLKRGVRVYISEKTDRKESSQMSSLRELISRFAYGYDCLLSSEEEPQKKGMIQISGKRDPPSVKQEEAKMILYPLVGFSKGECKASLERFVRL